MQYGDFSGRSWNEAASFVQSCAYFGMIIEVFKVAGINFTILQSGADEIIPALPGKTSAVPLIGDQERCNQKPGIPDVGYFSTTLLDMVLWWYHEEVDHDEAYKKERFQRVAEILVTVYLFVSKIFKQEYWGEEKLAVRSISCRTRNRPCERG
jgi:hypothetical protein